jgi:pimeloyl-ACP methyl ester carboxylesterase
MLHRIAQGEGPPLVVAHGLFGSGRNWGAIAKRLADVRRVVAVDMRNHGESLWSDDHSYEALAADLAEVIEAEGGRADLLGHSMGGKAAMALALAEPSRVVSLVVADIAPRAYRHTQAPMIEAMRSVDLSAVARRSDADAQLRDRVEDPAVRAFLLQSLDAAERRWRLNLDALDTGMDRLVGWPEPGGRYDGPALFLRGEASDYVTDADEPEIRRLFPRARVETIAGAGHWLHAEAPRPFEAALRAFLTSREAP